VGGWLRTTRKLEEREWQEIPAPPELAKALLTRRVRTQSIARDTSGALWLSPHKPACSGWRPASGSKFSYQVSHHPNIPSVIYADANGPIWLGYPHARIATLTHDNWRLYTEKDGITVGSVQVLGKVNNEIWAGGDRGTGT